MHFGGDRSGSGRGGDQGRHRRALEGRVVPQSIKLPTAVVSDPDFKKDANYYPEQSDNFFVGNAFPSCGINFTAQEIMSQTKE